MKVTVEDQSSVKKVLHIEVPRDVVTQELDQAYSELKKGVKVKGFRPGKAPRSVLERMYRKDVHNDVASKLIQDAFMQAVREKELQIIGPPTVAPPELQPDAPYAFDAVVEVRPEIGAIDLKGLTLTKALHEVSDDEIDLQLKMVQRNFARHNKIDADRPLQEGDVAVIDYEGFKDGVAHEATRKTENFSVTIGEGRVVKDLENGLLGMKVGEDKEIDVTFPDDYFGKALAGQTLHFKVKLNEIREEILPPLDDDLARSVGDQFDSLDALKAKIRENLQNGYDKRIEQELNEQVFAQLLAQVRFEVPDSMIADELAHIVKDAEKSFSDSNRSFEDVGLSQEQISEKYRPVAEKQVRRHFILSKIIEQENVTLSDEELESGLRAMASNFKQPVEQVKAYYAQNPDNLAYFKHALLEKKALRIIIDNSTLNEVEPPGKAGNEKTDQGA